MTRKGEGGWLQAQSGTGQSNGQMTSELDSPQSRTHYIHLEVSVV